MGGTSVEPQQQSLTGLAAALLAEGGRVTRDNAWQITTGQQPAKPQPPARPEDLNVYWPAYLRQLQLGGHSGQQPGASAAPSLAGPGVDVATAHAQLLQVLGSQAAATAASAGTGAGALSAPKPLRPSHDPSTSTPLSDLAAALRRQSPAAAAPASAPGPSAFSLPSAGAAALWAAAATSEAAAAAAGPHGSTLSAGGMRRQGSDSLRRGSSGFASNGARPTPGPIATGKRTGKRSARDTLASEALPFKKRPDLNRAPPAAAAADDDDEDFEEGPEMALVRMRSGEEQPQVLASDTSERGDEPPTPAGAGGAKCSKEKNRQAQRRFRERQKTLIGDLRESVRALQTDVEAQAKQIFVLQEENRLLKMLLSERQGLPNGQQQ